MSLGEKFDLDQSSIEGVYSDLRAQLVKEGLDNVLALYVEIRDRIFGDNFKLEDLEKKLDL